jgi:TolB-like protein
LLSSYRAIDLYDEKFFGDIDFNEPAFIDWLNTKRIEVELAAIESGLLVLGRSNQLNSTDGRYFVLKVIRIDPFFEIAVHLIRQHVKSGNMKLALRQYKVCEAILFDELGIEPAPETQRALESQDSQIISLSQPVDQVERSITTPSLVVLPIDNISGDSALNFLSFGLADDITNELTRYRDLFVISRESAFGLDIIKDTSPAVCQRLGVCHCLRGSFRKTGNEFHVNLHLVDGESGQSVWSERYNLSQLELMALPIEVTQQIVSRLATWMERDALVRAGLKPAKNWSAYEHLLKGLAHHHQSGYSTFNLRKAIKHFEQAINIDLDCARAYAYLACAKNTPYFRERDKSLLETSKGLAQHAVRLDPTESEAHRIMGGVHLAHGEHDLSRQYFEEAEAIHLGHAHILAHTARYYIHTGDPDKAIKLLGQARQLNPAHPPWYWEHLGMTHFGKRNYSESLAGFA